jgi:hypothetical protein
MVVEQIINTAHDDRLKRRRGRLLSLLVRLRTGRPSFDSWEPPIKCVEKSRVAGV